MQPAPNIANASYFLPTQTANICLDQLITFRILDFTFELFFFVAQLAKKRPGYQFRNSGLTFAIEFPNKALMGSHLGISIPNSEGQTTEFKPLAP